MLDKSIDVSFVMTVYNKEFYLPSVLTALLNQEGLENPEFIFIDDLSKDDSVKIIKQYIKNVPNAVLVENKENRGISVRTNQGIALARGKYIRMLDSDDILPINSTRKMLDIAQKLNADIVYGCFSKTNRMPQELVNEKIGDFDYSYSPDALLGVLNGRFTRMGQLIKTSVLKNAQGADERVFIQDESIPLRAAIHAHGIVKISENAVLVPKEMGNFSANKLQLDHDRFLAYFYTIIENPQLPKKALRLMYRRAVSAYWKMKRKTLSYPYFSFAFVYYLLVRIFPLMPNLSLLTKMKNDFLSLPNIRRMG